MSASRAGLALALLGAAAVLATNPSTATTPTADPFASLASGPELPGFSLAEVELMATTCGKERWSVKTGTDADRAKINLSATPTTVTIDTLRGKARPSSLPSNGRARPVETTVYFTTGAVLKQYKVEDDGDIHLVLRSSAGRTVVAELPNPSCVGSTSPLRTRIVGARKQFLAAYPSPTTSWKYPNRAVRVKSVGYFDYLHGQTGMAPNGIELHPVIGVYW